VVGVIPVNEITYNNKVCLITFFLYLSASCITYPKRGSTGYLISTRLS
jgi:hypothetical protein